MNRSEHDEERVPYGVVEAARLLSVGRSQVHELIRSGELVTVTVGRRRARPGRLHHRLCGRAGCAGGEPCRLSVDARTGGREPLLRRTTRPLDR